MIDAARREALDDTQDAPLDNEEDDLEDDYLQLDELEKLETIILLMEELKIQTLEEARLRFEALERSIDNDA